MTIPAVNGFDLDETRRRLALSGYAYVTGLPESFDYPGELARLGPLVPQYGGALVRDVKPDPSVPNTIVSSANTAELTPHTEWYEFPGLPPRYVALWCVHPAAGPGGETTLADGYALLDRFTTAERERLMRHSCEWRSSLLTRQGIDQVARQPIIETHAGQTVLRSSTLDIVADDDLTRRYVARGREFFDTTRVAMKIERGAILVWDNWRMMHARNGFTDPHRHLRRVLIGVSE